MASIRHPSSDKTDEHPASLRVRVRTPAPPGCASPGTSGSITHILPDYPYITIYILLYYILPIYYYIISSLTTSTQKPNQTNWQASSLRVRAPVVAPSHSVTGQTPGRTSQNWSKTGQNCSKLVKYIAPRSGPRAAVRDHGGREEMSPRKTESRRVSFAAGCAHRVAGQIRWSHFAGFNDSLMLTNSPMLAKGLIGCWMRAPRRWSNTGGGGL
jgi:hypothetical protein